MQDPLREIFENIYEGKITVHPMTAQERAVWDAAQAVLGGDLVDKMLYSQSRSLAEGQYDCFRQGFRLGAMLTRELI